MPCEEWSRIVFQYSSAVRAYSNTARTLRSASGAVFGQAWEQSERARKASEGFRTALLEHEHRHRCHIGHGPAKGNSADKGHPSSKSVKMRQLGAIDGSVSSLGNKVVDNEVIHMDGALAPPINPSWRT
jgi:hypothetical protein